MPHAHFIDDSEIDCDYDDLDGEIVGDKHPGAVPVAHHEQRPKRPSSSAGLTPCPHCGGSLIRDPLSARQPCRHCDEIGYVNLPTDRASLDRLFDSTHRGSLERIGVMAQRYRLGMTVMPDAMADGFELDVELEEIEA